MATEDGAALAATQETARMTDVEDVKQARAARVDRELARSIVLCLTALFAVLLAAYGVHLLLGD